MQGCPLEPEGVAAQVAAWAAVLPDVSSAGFEARRRGHRRGPVLRLGQVPYPRRAVLGLPVHAELDLACDETARTVQVLRLLQGRGRAVVVPVVPEPEGEPEQGPEPARAQEPEQQTADRHATRLSADGCLACGVCVRACPEDALRLDHSPGLSVLTHLRESCRGELACIRLCPHDALRAVGRLGPQDLVAQPSAVVARVPTRPCTRCGARHASPEDDLCPACRFRWDNPFGSSLVAARR